MQFKRMFSTDAYKGTSGYLRTQKNYEILRTVLYFAISLSLFIAGWVTTGSRENLLTIVAVLGCLPACKSIVNLIMLCRAKGCSREAYEQIRPCEGRLIGMCDLYFTSYQKNFPISHMVVDGKVILGFSENEKCDLDAATAHLQTMLKQGGFKDYTITLTKDLKKYCEQLKNRSEAQPERNPEKEDEVRVLFYEITL